MSIIKLKWKTEVFQKEKYKMEGRERRQNILLSNVDDDVKSVGALNRLCLDFFCLFSPAD